MKKFLLTLLFFVLLVGAGIWYILQPKVLGVKYTKENLAAGYDKLNVTFDPLTATGDDKTLVLSGAHKVDATFSSAELTAMADNRRAQYVYFPFRKVQIRVNEDGSVEGSAVIAFSDAVRYLLALGVSSRDIEAGAKQFKIPNTTLPVYLKISGNIANNKSHITVDGADIAHIPVPTDLLGKYTPAFNSFIESVIKARQPSYNIETLSAEGGTVHFIGTAPDKEQAVKSL